MIAKPVILSIALGVVVVSGCDKGPSGGTGEVVAGKSVVSFEREIKPLLSNKCTICHNREVLPNRPNFETREGAMASGVIVPGKPEQSRFVMVTAEKDIEKKAMPPVGHKVTESERSLLIRWIAEGADWPAGEAGRVKPAFIPKE